MYIYRVFPTGRDGRSPLPPAKYLLIPPHLEKFPSRLPLPPKVNPPWPH